MSAAVVCSSQALGLVNYQYHQLALTGALTALLTHRPSALWTTTNQKLRRLPRRRGLCFPSLRPRARSFSHLASDTTRNGPRLQLIRFQR